MFIGILNLFFVFSLASCFLFLRFWDLEFFFLVSLFLFIDSYFFISILISKISHLYYCFLCASTTGGSPLNGLAMRPMVFAPREAARSTLRSP